MKNEAMNVSEWIDHYFWIGATRLFLIDNGSTDNTIALVDNHPRRDDIDVIVLTGRHMQVQHYKTAISKFGILDRCKWLMIADLDEFWFCKDGRKIPEYLKDQVGFDVIYANWSHFGSNGLDEHPASLRLELLFRRPKLDNNNCTKWIARCASATSSTVFLIHKIRGMDSEMTCSDNENLQINHYITQSKKYYRDIKMSRGDVNRTERENWRNWSYYENANIGCDKEDRTLANHLKNQADEYG